MNALPNEPINPPIAAVPDVTWGPSIVNVARIVANPPAIKPENRVKLDIASVRPARPPADKATVFAKSARPATIFWFSFTKVLADWTSPVISSTKLSNWSFIASKISYCNASKADLSLKISPDKLSILVSAIVAAIPAEVLLRSSNVLRVSIPWLFRAKNVFLARSLNMSIISALLRLTLLNSAMISVTECISGFTASKELPYLLRTTSTLSECAIS